MRDEGTTKPQRIVVAVDVAVSPSSSTSHFIPVSGDNHRRGCPKFVINGAPRCLRRIGVTVRCQRLLRMSQLEIVVSRRWPGVASCERNTCSSIVFNLEWRVVQADLFLDECPKPQTKLLPEVPRHRHLTSDDISRDWQSIMTEMDVTVSCLCSRLYVSGLQSATCIASESKASRLRSFGNTRLAVVRDATLAWDERLRLRCIPGQHVCSCEFIIAEASVTCPNSTDIFDVIAVAHYLFRPILVI